MRLHMILRLVLVMTLGEATTHQQEVVSWRETVREAAGQVKHLVHTSLTGTLASTFPEDDPRNPEWPYAIMEYHAPCLPPPGLLFMLFPQSISTQNVRRSDGSRATYTLSQPVDGVRSPISRGRVAFMGNMTFLSDLTEDQHEELRECYKRYHPDTFWFPDRQNTSLWDSSWVKFTPRDIYYVGGFGSTHFIGHIPVDIYAEAEDPGPQEM